MNRLVAGTGLLTRFALKQDRFRIPVWLLSLSVMTWLTAWSFTSLYETAEDRQVIAETMRNPAMTAMLGKGYGLDDYTIGAMTAHQMLLFTVVLVAVMNILLTARHTRAQEEDGRIELIRSLPAGRLSNLASAFAVLVAANGILALAVGFGLFALNVESIDLEGSLLYGAALGAAGIFFSALTALMAQLSDSARGTVGLSLGILGAAYVLRAVGDVSNETLSFLSPLGWILGTEVYVNNYWWPLGLVLSAAVLCAVLAVTLNMKRDLGAGFLPSKPGRKTASAFLRGPFGLALRLQRTSIIVWTVAVFLIGASYGSVLGDLESFFESIESMRQMLPDTGSGTLTDQYVAMLMAVMAMISTVPVLLTMLKLRSEEKKGRIDHLLSREVSRSRLIGSYVMLTGIVSVVMQLSSAFGLWAVSNAMMTNGLDLPAVIGAAGAYLPAIWVTAGFAVLLTGGKPEWTGASYLLLGYSFFILYMGGLLQLPPWTGKLSPFDYIPRLPAEELELAVLVLLTGVAAMLTAIGFAGYRKRDIR